MNLITKYYVSWDDVHAYITTIADTFKDRQFDCILSIARGGAILGTMLSHKLNIPTQYIGISSYNNTQKTNNIKYYQYPNLLNYKNIIVIDDIIDTGDTINSIKTDIAANMKDSQFTYTTMYATLTQSTKVDYYYKLKTDEWIQFPWEC